MTRTFALGRIGLAAIAFVVLTAGESGAKGLILFTWGETISPVGDVSPSKRNEVGVDKVGFKYAYHGMFWLDFWRSDGTYCVYEGDKYVAIEPAMAAMFLGKKEDELSRPFFYHVPPGLLVAGPILLLWLVSVVQDKMRAAETARLFRDPEYKKALQIVNDEYGKQSEGPDGPPTASQEERYRTALAAGVEYLVGTGIERSEAQWNLETMVRAVDHAAENPGAEVPGYRIPCECGEKLIVTAGMAGSTATCTCGRAVTVPSLNELKSM